MSNKTSKLYAIFVEILFVALLMCIPAGAYADQTEQVQVCNGLGDAAFNLRIVRNEGVPKEYAIKYYKEQYPFSSRREYILQFMPQLLDVVYAAPDELFASQLRALVVRTCFDSLKGK